MLGHKVRGQEIKGCYQVQPRKSGPYANPWPLIWLVTHLVFGLQDATLIDFLARVSIPWSKKKSQKIIWCCFTRALLTSSEYHSHLLVMSTRTIASRLLRSGPSHRPFSSCPRRQNSAQAVAETHGSSTSSLSAVTPEATSSSSTASSSNFAIKAESGRSTSKSSAKIISSLILSRLPTILREPSAFETAYFNYNQRLAEALQQPFARDFYFKKGSAIEAKFNEEQAKLSLGFTDIEKPVKKTTQKTPESSNQSTAAEGVTEVQPLPRTTEADEQEDEKSLNRKLDRTLYLMVKSSDTAPWSFPATVLDKGDTLHRVSCGPNTSYSLEQSR